MSGKSDDDDDDDDFSVSDNIAINCRGGKWDNTRERERERESCCYRS